MRDQEAVRFLQWALPRAGLRWPGFRKVRNQVKKRLRRRMVELGIDPDDEGTGGGLAAYRARLEQDPGEWARFERACRIPISRFYRDRSVFDRLADTVLPELAAAALTRGASRLAVWSVPCAAGEEPYTLAILWRERLAARFCGLGLRLLGTDVDRDTLARAEAGRYAPSSVKDLPAAWRERWFRPEDGELVLDPAIRADVELRCEDLRATTPDEVFDLVLCRNLVFTYFDLPLQQAVLPTLAARVAPGGGFVTARKERLPGPQPWFEPWLAREGIWRRTSHAVPT